MSKTERGAEGFGSTGLARCPCPLREGHRTYPDYFDEVDEDVVFEESF